MKNMYRRYKICQITNEGISSEEKEIVELLLTNIKDLTHFTDEHNNHGYSDSEGNSMFQYDSINDKLWITTNFWKILASKYSYHYNDIQTIILEMLNTIYHKK